MNSQTIPQFWRCYERLPQQVQQRADEAYQKWRENSHAVGLHFKRVGKTRPIYAIRIDGDYRALGLLQEDTITWFWIGTHDEYMRLLKHA